MHIKRSHDKAFGPAESGERKQPAAAASGAGSGSGSGAGSRSGGGDAKSSFADDDEVEWLSSPPPRKRARVEPPRRIRTAAEIFNSIHLGPLPPAPAPAQQPIAAELPAQPLSQVPVAQPPAPSWEDENKRRWYVGKLRDPGPGSIRGLINWGKRNNVPEAFLPEHEQRAYRIDEDNVLENYGINNNDGGCSYTGRYRGSRRRIGLW